MKKRAPKMREVKSTLQIVRERRAQQELSDASQPIATRLNKPETCAVMSYVSSASASTCYFVAPSKLVNVATLTSAFSFANRFLKIRPNEGRASALLVTARRERHVYVRQMTADKWDEEHRLLSQQQQASLLPQLIGGLSEDWAEIDRRRRPPTRGLDEAEES